MDRLLPTRTEILIGIALAAVFAILCEITEDNRVQQIMMACMDDPKLPECSTLPPKEP